MIKIENTEVLGWEAAIRGMRNPMNSWAKSDTFFFRGTYIQDGKLMSDYVNGKGEYPQDSNLTGPVIIGAADHKLMMNLAKSGSTHAKYRRMIVVYADILAPLYWWKEFDTYRMGVEKNSCSTMHKIQAKEFTLEDFSCEHMSEPTKNLLDDVIFSLNTNRKEFNNRDFDDPKYSWWQMIQSLPSSYNQKRTVMMSYEALSSMYRDRKDHKLDEWRDFCAWVKNLPYSEIITLEESE